jgi:hypothetical protein
LLRQNHRSVEMANRLDLINEAFKFGYLAYLPVVDEGIDLILHRERPRDLKMVQLKSRWTIDKKYVGREIWIAFPQDKVWYLGLHDEFVGLAKKLGFAANSSSWTAGGKYSRGKLNKALQETLQAYTLEKQLGATTSPDGVS